MRLRLDHALLAAALGAAPATPARAQASADPPAGAEPAPAVRAAAARIEHLPDWGRAAEALGAPIAAPLDAAAGRPVDAGPPAVPVGDGRAGGAGRKAIAAAVLAAGAAPGASLSWGQSAMAFGAGQRLAAAERVLAGWGLPARDLASAAAFAFVTDWHLATGRPLDGEAAGAAARVMARRFAQATPDVLGRPGAPGRAAAYEAMLGHAQALAEVGQGAAGALADGVRQAAAACFARQFGLAPGAVRLGAGGGPPAVAVAAEARAAGAGGAPDAPTVSDPPNAPSAGASAEATAGLAGVWRADWVENEFRALVGLVLVAKNVTLVLTPDGYAIDGVPRGQGLDGAAARALMAAEPDRAGRYRVQGGAIELTYASGRRATAAVTRSAAGTGRTALVLSGRTLGRKLGIPDGTRFDGVYAQERITQVSGMNAPGGAIAVVGASDLRFRPDGRFEAGGSTSFTSPNASRVGARSRQTGRYTVRGGALVLDFDDGGRAVRSLWQEDRGGPIWLDDEMWTPRG